MHDLACADVDAVVRIAEARDDEMRADEDLVHGGLNVVCAIRPGKARYWRPDRRLQHDVLLLRLICATYAADHARATNSLCRRVVVVANRAFKCERTVVIDICNSSAISRGRQSSSSSASTRPSAAVRPKRS